MTKDDKAGVTGTKESGLSGSSVKRADVGGDVADYDAAFDGPNSKDWREAEQKLQADDDARRDRVLAEQRAVQEAHDEAAAGVANEVAHAEDFLPDEKIRVTETDEQRIAREHGVVAES